MKYVLGNNNIKEIKEQLFTYGMIYMLGYQWQQRQLAKEVEAAKNHGPVATLFEMT